MAILVSLTVVALGDARVAPTEPLTVKEITAMQFALGCTILSGWNYPRPLFSAVPTPEERAPIFAFIRHAGFDGVDLADSWLNWFAMSDDDLRGLRQQVESYGLVCAGLNPYRSILVRHEAAASNEERLYRTVEVAAILGASVVNIPD